MVTLNYSLRWYVIHAAARHPMRQPDGEYRWYVPSLDLIYRRVSETKCSLNSVMQENACPCCREIRKPEKPSLVIGSFGCLHSQNTTKHHGRGRRNPL